MSAAVQPVVTKSGYAAYRGCSPAYVSKLIREGRLAAPALLDNGRINIALADQLIGPPGGTTAGEAPILASPPSAARHAAAPAATARLTEARAEAAATQQQLAQLRLQRERGELIPAAGVAAETEDAFRQVRDLLLQGWHDIAEDCARLADATAIEATILRALKSRLAEAAAILQRDPAALVDAA